MWPRGRPVFSSVSCVRCLQRCATRETRNLSYAAAKPEENSTHSDPTLPIDTPPPKELLASIGAPREDSWHTASSFENLATQNEMLRAPVVPALMWNDTFSESDAYWKQKRQKQLKLEENFVYESLEEYRQFVNDVRRREKAATLPLARELLQRWHGPLINAIKTEQDKALKSKKALNAARQYLQVLEADELSILTIHTVLGVLLSGNSGDGDDGRVPFVEVAGRVGRAVQAQINLLKLKHRVETENKRRARLARYVKGLKSEGTEPQLPSELADWEKRLIQRALKMDSKIHMIKNRWNNKNTSIKDVYLSQWTLRKEQARWTDAITIQVGAMLVNLFKESADAQIDKMTGKVMGSKATSICVAEPVLKHEIVWQRNTKGPRQLGVLTMHPAIVQKIESSEAHSAWALTRAQPMVYPPEPWRGYDVGGYLSTPSRVLRSFDHEEPALLVRRADSTGQLDQVYQALTLLGRTPWVMNKRIFEVVEKVWQQGGGKLGLPSRVDVPLPSEPYSTFKAFSHKGALYASFCEDTAQQTKFRKSALYRARKKNCELRSLRCDMELKLGVARNFLEEDRIYFPHNMDFRGRAYPIPPHLNHLGNDMCRALLMFADARPLGKGGLDWLYIQIANLYGAGENKKTLHERLQFGLDSLDKILDSANDPLGGLQWWMEGDSPWQLLATCIEIRDALRSDNPETFLSRMHVHQDGSCNGLQHYAALSRDAVGAVAVNLRSAEVPNDVYSGIAQVVSRIVAEDAAQGHKWAQILNGHVDRKLVKQTVMTSVYGVTFIGAREQISNRLKERGWEDDSNLFHISNYAAKVTMAGLHEMFHNAKDVMHWLAECAAKIASANQTVSWTTPIGLPVGQPYRNRSQHSVQTVLQTVSLAQNRVDMPVMKRRQRSAFPPNYVHSLDATHMMMTALGCHEKGVTFAGVHDSFWTHAGSVDTMNEVLRNKFYELHSRPLISELLQEFRKSYPEISSKFPELPKLGDLDLKEIYNARYFFA